MVKNENNEFRAFQVCLELHPENQDRETKGLVEACRFFRPKGGVLSPDG